MANYGETCWPPLQPRRQGQQQAVSRPGSAVSVASSASSFRIPGIFPTAPARGQKPQTPTQRPAPSPAFVHLFGPNPHEGDVLRPSLDADVTPSLAWLSKHGPLPEDLVQLSQTGPNHLQSEQPAGRGELGISNQSDTRNDQPGLRKSGEQLRPFTASSYHRNKLVTADGSVGSYVCAILENRGTGREVGIASIERETGLCVITQFADTPTYVRTIHHLAMYPPSTLLVPASGLSNWKSTPSATASGQAKRPYFSNNARDSSGGSVVIADQRSNTSILIQCIEELFEIKAQPFPRRHWNYFEGSDTFERSLPGARYLDRLLVDDVDEPKHSRPEDDHEDRGQADAQGAAIHSQPTKHTASSRPHTGRHSLEASAKASTRAAILVAVANKFYLLSAVAGLFDFFIDTFNRVFTPNSLRIRFVVPEGTILINSNTAHDLELVRNLIDPRSKDSLYGLLDHCASPMGRRLLKMNILQPLTDLDVITTRQDAVAECIRNEERFYAIRESLKPIRDGAIDLDKLIHALSFQEGRKAATAEARSTTERKLENVLSLRTLLRSLGPVRAALQNSSSCLLQSVQLFLGSEELDALNESIQTTIDEDILHARGGLGSRNAKMYAVRAERSPLLDVARETYRENLNDIFQLRDQETDETGIKFNLKMISTGFLVWPQSKSYHCSSIEPAPDKPRTQFQAHLESSQIAALPERFTNVSKAKSGKIVTMLTLPLKKLNARLGNSMNEVCMMSEKIISELIDGIIGQIASLYRVSEALSILDMVVSFAHVSIANDYVRPAFGDTLDIRDGRHPILDRVDVPTTGAASIVARRRQPFVANDIYLASGERFCLVTGPNMSGKSTFLRQIALITVLAGIGCFVPATRASLPIPDAILSLLTHEDDATQNLSTFAAEMRTSAFILSVSTPRSLVILDELGRGTSPDEGSAIATAMIEEMINEKGSTVFFATHFGELVDGLDGKEGVVCQHLQVSTVQGSDEVGLVFHHKLHLGPGLNTHYSLQVAKMMGCFSASFLAKAQHVAVSEHAVNVDRDAVMDSQTRDRRRLLRSVVRDLRRLAKGQASDQFDDDGAKAESQPLTEKIALLQHRTSDELIASF